MRSAGVIPRGLVRTTGVIPRGVVGAEGHGSASVPEVWFVTGFDLQDIQLHILVLFTLPCWFASKFVSAERNCLMCDLRLFSGIIVGFLGQSVQSHLGDLVGDIRMNGQLQDLHLMAQ